MANFNLKNFLLFLIIFFSSNIFTMQPGKGDIDPAIILDNNNDDSTALDEEPSEATVSSTKKKRRKKKYGSQDDEDETLSGAKKAKTVEKKIVNLQRNINNSRKAKAVIDREKNIEQMLRTAIMRIPTPLIKSLM